MVLHLGNVDIGVVFEYKYLIINFCIFILIYKYLIITLECLICLRHLFYLQYAKCSSCVFFRKVIKYVPIFSYIMLISYIQILNFKEIFRV